MWVGYVKVWAVNWRFVETTGNSDVIQIDLKDAVAQEELFKLSRVVGLLNREHFHRWITAVAAVRRWFEGRPVGLGLIQ